MNGLMFSYVVMLGNIAVAYEIDKSGKIMVKRQADEVVVYTVELLIVVDPTIYQYWIKNTPQHSDNATEKDVEVEKRIRSHYKSVVSGMNVRFSSEKTLVFTIDILITDVIILKNVSESAWLSGDYITEKTLDATRTLSDFRKWGQMTSDLPMFDHAMLFTRYDLTKDGSDSVAGLAYTGTMCTGTSMSIVEDRMTAQSYTVATHELAHSLGARHDGTNNRCSSDDNFIMSEVTSVSGDLEKNRNSWRFSECSVEYFTEHIASLDAREINCLVNGGRANDSEASISDVSKDVISDMSEPVPSADQQCKRVQGEESVLCRNLYRENYTDFCALMYCSIDDVTCNYRLPLDGTTCGHNKVCRAGYCIFQNAVVTNTTVNLSEKCPFGDQPGIIKASNLDCPDSIAKMPHLCYQEFYATRCCHSCEQEHTSLLGCEYGDKAEKCKAVSYIDCLIGEEACCDTCTSYMTTLNDLIIPTSSSGAALVFLIVVVCVVVMVRRRRRRRRKARKDNVTSQDDIRVENERNMQLSDLNRRSGYTNEGYQHPGSSAVHGFRVPGSRHEPVFQYDRNARQLLLSTVLANKDLASSWRQTHAQTPESVTMPTSPVPGNGVMYPGKGVIYQLPPAWAQFNLRDFGDGRRALPAPGVIQTRGTKSN